VEGRTHEIAFILLLHAHIIAHGAKIISQMQKAGRPNATHHYFLPFFHEAAKIRKVTSRQWAVGSGQWAVGSWQWAVGSGQGVTCFNQW